MHFCVCLARKQEMEKASIAFVELPNKETAVLI